MIEDHRIRAIIDLVFMLDATPEERDEFNEDLKRARESNDFIRIARGRTLTNEEEERARRFFGITRQTGDEDELVAASRRIAKNELAEPVWSHYGHRRFQFAVEAEDDVDGQPAGLIARIRRRSPKRAGKEERDFVSSLPMPTLELAVEDLEKRLHTHARMTADSLAAHLYNAARVGHGG